MLDGACLCGRVRYQIDGRPRFMYQCHCGKCRAASGASFVTNMIVDADRFSITAGKEFSPPSSSPLRCGTLKQDPGVRVAYHAFVDSKAPWIDLRDEQPQFAEWADPALVKRLFHESGEKW